MFQCKTFNIALFKFYKTMDTIKNFNHVIPLKSYNELISMTLDNALSELQNYTDEYYSMLSSWWHITKEWWSWGTASLLWPTDEFWHDYRSGNDYGIYSAQPALYWRIKYENNSRTKVVGKK